MCDEKGGKYLMSKTLLWCRKADLKQCALHFAIAWNREEKLAGELGRLWIPCVGHGWLCAFAVAFGQGHVQYCTSAPFSPHLLLLPLMVGLQY